MPILLLFTGVDVVLGDPAVVTGLDVMLGDPAVVACGEVEGVGAGVLVDDGVLVEVDGVLRLLLIYDDTLLLILVNNPISYTFLQRLVLYSYIRFYI